MTARKAAGGFGHFFRRYTKTWMHAVATAGLTAFGMLTFVHRGFAVLAVASYVVPPVVLYFTRTESDGDPVGSDSPTDAALEADSTHESDSGRDRDRGPPPARERSAESATERSTNASDGPAPSATLENQPPADEPSLADEPAPPDESAPPNEPAAQDEPAPSAAPTGDGATGPDADAFREWERVDAPADATLFDVAVTASGAVAVGAGGIVLELEPEADEWSTVLEDGPAAGGQDLRGVDTTGDGEAAWIAGDGGAVGRLETGSGRHADHSAPDDRTDTLAGIAVAGSSGDETVLLINGSGEVLRGEYRGDDVAWSEPIEPGSGSSLSGVALADDAVGFACDTNDGVFRTDDGGRSFETVGLEGADGTLTDVAVGGPDECHVSTDAGVVHRYDGSRWTPERVCDAALGAIARREGRLLAAGEDGAVYARADATADWDRVEPGVDGPLEGVAIGPVLATAVGGEETLIERR